MTTAPHGPYGGPCGLVQLPDGALDVVGVEALHSWETTLDASNVVRSPIVESPFGWHLNVRAPDNIAVELLAMKPEASAALCG